jgi:hypothetical protein
MNSATNTEHNMNAATKDFSRNTIKALAKKGINLVAPAMVPDERGYLINDNGVGRIVTFRDILAMVR